MKKLLFSALLFLGVCFQLKAEFRGRIWFIIREKNPNFPAARIVDGGPGKLTKVERRAGKNHAGQCAYAFPEDACKPVRVEADFLVKAPGNVLPAFNGFFFEGHGPKAKIRPHWYSLTDVEVNGKIIQKGTKWYRNEVTFSKYPVKVMTYEVINISATVRFADEAQSAKLDKAAGKK